MNILRLEWTNINKVLTVPFVTSQKDTDNGPSGPGGAVAVVGTVASQQEVPGLGVSVYFLCGVWGRTGAARHTRHHHNCTTSSVFMCGVKSAKCLITSSVMTMQQRRWQNCSLWQKKPTGDTKFSLHQLVGLFIISNDTMYSTVYSSFLFFKLAIVGDAFFFGIVNSENDKMHFRKLLIQAVYDQGEGSRSDPLLFTFFFFFFFLNNTCHLIVLSLWYLHRYSRLSFITSRDLLGLFFFLFIFFNVLSHSFLKELYLQP